MASTYQNIEIGDERSIVRIGNYEFSVQQIRSAEGVTRYQVTRCGDRRFTEQRPEARELCTLAFDTMDQACARALRLLRQLMMQDMTLICAAGATLDNLNL